MARVLAASTTSGTFSFPIVTAPTIYLIYYTTVNSTGSITLLAQVVDASSGGTPGGAVGTLNTTVTGLSRKQQVPVL